MRFGFSISLLLHALILGWGLIAMSSARDFKKPDMASIALEIITSDELAQMRKGDETSKELEAKAAKDAQGKAEKEPAKPKVAAAAPPPPPPPPVPEQAKLEELVKEAAKPEPKPPEPKPPEQKPPPPAPLPPPQEQAKLDDLVKEVAKPEEKPAPPVPAPKPPDPPKAVEKPKPPPPKPKPPVKVAEAKPSPKPTPPVTKPSSFDEQMRKAGLAADDAEPSPLLDKDPRRQKSAHSTASADPASKAKTAAGTRDGTAARTSQSEMNALAGQLAGMIKKCYRAQAGNAVERDELVVKIRFDLGTDGMLKGEPIVLEAARFSLGTLWAVNALKGCQPYRLDPDKYAGWKEWDLTFQP